MAPSRLAHWGGLAASLGGLLWVVKSSVILLTNGQPGGVIGSGAPLFAIGLLALYSQLKGYTGRTEQVGLLLACISIAAWIAAFLLPSVPFLATMAGAGPFGSLAALTSATRKAEILPAGWRALPLVIALFPLSAILWAAFALSVGNTSLVELSTILLGLGWILLGYFIWTNGRTSGTASAPSTDGM